VASVAVPLRRGVKKNISRNERNVLQRAQRLSDRKDGKSRQCRSFIFIFWVVKKRGERCGFFAPWRKKIFLATDATFCSVRNGCQIEKTVKAVSAKVLFLYFGL
jgi:hypothetical protein